MKKLAILSLSAIALFAASCGDNKVADTGITLTPEMGTTYNAGAPVDIKVNYPDEIKPDSVVYLLDSVRYTTAKDGSGFALKTGSMKLGTRLITAKIFQAGKSIDISTSFSLYAAKAPEELKFVVEKVFPHDTASYTEGLIYQDGILYESDGGRAGEQTGRSSLRKVNLETGKPIKEVPGDPKVFNEGIAIVGDKLIMMTYTERIGYVYNKNTLDLTKTFPNNVGVEGWGLCSDDKQIYMDDSTNRIWFLNKDNYAAQGYIDVCDDKSPKMQINELEMIDGKIYANVYTTNDILVIDPKTGAVLQHVDMTDLWPLKDRPADFDSVDKVFNGIAWDAKGKRLFVTGKKWPHLYQIRLEKK
ncbi:glutaminyl-peptide cyclotransferase [Mucilaginibacter myungsuensis]|uniref:Glutaminyl-peptide cyclotransferase n=1 Tax=Mucilaginibacter myungsuensis TaxID=649104 RepID=A0A929KZH5_9SPHI|nr:glutaminyl-peptide cyclotransferase [Mucilaginibacter myungsuensis]MBE9663467.1 glutaminyl-peptide cyclotransferase [Mucilaginibacter myungsuensis]MDN3600205.1 glutaminyl-peptide cyclotransferase [Mucilaginibacter myungsuensis]